MTWIHQVVMNMDIFLLSILSSQDQDGWWLLLWFVKSRNGLDTFYLSIWTLLLLFLSTHSRSKGQFLLLPQRLHQVHQRSCHILWRRMILISVSPLHQDQINMWTLSCCTLFVNESIWAVLTHPTLLHNVSLIIDIIKSSAIWHIIGSTRTMQFKCQHYLQVLDMDKGYPESMAVVLTHLCKY